MITVLFIRTDRLSCIHICIIYYENQGPRFGENYISAKQPNENQGDQLNASFQLLLNINRMLITRVGDSFAYNESRQDSYPQFPWSQLGTPGSMAWDRHKRKKQETPAFLESCSAKASLTNKQ